VKLDVTNPAIYAVIVGVLLGWRVVRAISRRQAAAATRTAAAQ
jgi:DMSO/TMAO reductase YedYZ heme-binding membrane subunit